MADYYEQFSDQLIVELTDEEKAWVEKILRPVDSTGGWDAETIKQEGDEETAFLLEHIEPTLIEDDDWPRFTWEVDAEGVWMYDDGGCFRAEHVTEFVHAFIKKFRPKMVWKMTWAGTCTRPLLGSFGGGWAVVDIHGATFGTVWSAADEEVKRKRERAERDRLNKKYGRT